MDARTQASRQISVGVDGSQSARHAVRFAAREAALRGLGLRIISATLWPELADRAGRAAEQPERRMLADADAVLAEASDLAAEVLPAAAVTAVLVIDNPATALIEESYRSALLVLGTPGLGALRGPLLGPVSAEVAAHAHCPVAVVPDTTGEQSVGATVVMGVDGPSYAQRPALCPGLAGAGLVSQLPGWRAAGRTHGPA